jgi:hypothetical protein
MNLPKLPAALPAGATLLLLLLLTAVTGRAQTVISALPYTINAPGDYVLGANLTYAGASGATAITISANCVTLNLNGFYLYNSTASATGIAVAASCVTIQNGTLIGFGTGMALSGASNTVTGVRFEANAQYGVQLTNARGSTVANCQIDQSGYGWTTGQPVTGAKGIGLSVNGSGNAIKNNQITVATKGIESLSGGNLLDGNVVATTTTGIELRPGDRLRDNVTPGVQTPYVAQSGGGDDLGGND